MIPVPIFRPASVPIAVLALAAVLAVAGPVTAQSEQMPSPQVRVPVLSRQVQTSLVPLTRETLPPQASNDAILLLDRQPTPRALSPVEVELAQTLLDRLLECWHTNMAARHAPRPRLIRPRGPAPALSPLRLLSGSRSVVTAAQAPENFAIVQQEVPVSPFAATAARGLEPPPKSPAVRDLAPPVSKATPAPEGAGDTGSILDELRAIRAEQKAMRTRLDVLDPDGAGDRAAAPPAATTKTEVRSSWEPESPPLAHRGEGSAQ